MRVFEFFEFCPPDHSITIFFAQSNKEVFLEDKKSIFNITKGLTYKDLNEEIGFIHAEDFKSFYITTKL